MKKLFLTAMAVAVALAGKAQLVEVASVDRVALPEGITSEQATLSPDGSYAVIGQFGATTLYKVDLATGESTLLTSNASPVGVTISPDGSNVVYRTVSYKKNLRYTGLDAVNTSTGAVRQLAKPSRRLNAGVAISDNAVTLVENGRARTKSIGSGKSLSMPVASINYGHLDITVDGKTTTIDPQGRGSYLWPAISPDGTKVVYTLSGAGTFVCDLDGSNARQLGRLQAAKWLGNDMVVGMNEYDNGQQYTSSEIVVMNLDGASQVIVPAETIALYPSASADGKTIVYSTASGELYRINLK